MNREGHNDLPNILLTMFRTYFFGALTINGEYHYRLTGHSYGL